MRRVINQFQFSDIQKNVISNFNNIIELQSIKKIQINLQPSDIVTVANEESRDYFPSFSQMSNAKIQYSHLFIKPMQINRMSGTADVAEIYGYSDDNTPLSVADFLIKDSTLKTSSLGNEKLGVYFEKYTGASKDLDEKHEAHLLGKLKISDPTYYDYSSGTVRTGFAANSIIGETIPYTFKGDYTRELDLSFNAAFKNMKISFSEKLGTSVLNPFEGSVKLSLKTEEAPKQNTLRKITPEDIKMIRARKTDLGLNGLINLNEHQIQ